jgi:hypothetical protein
MYSMSLGVAQLYKLIFIVLLVCGDASINGDLHGLGFLGLPPFLPFSRAALAFALDVTEPPSLPSAAAIFEICFWFTL